jgi:two-component system sensor histidine kinase KdpD
LRRETAAARRSERRARQLQELATELASASLPAEIHLLGQRFLNRALPGPCLLALFKADGTLNLPLAAPAHVGDGMRACIQEGAVLGPGTGRWQALHAWFLPLKSGRHVAGAAYVPGAHADDHEGREHAQAICALVAQASARLELAASTHAAEERSRWHRAQNTLLAAISHDFRTPLAAIVGAASSLQAQHDKLAPQAQDKLLATVLDEADYLSTLTENTLEYVRLASDGEVHFDWQAMEEIVGAVLARVRRRDPDRRIQARVPGDLPLVQADPVLLAQLLENLLDNALKYGAGPIDIVVAQEGAWMELAVLDRGPGIPAGEEQAIFEPFRRGDRCGPRGAGLGLALCRAIARAHDGDVSLHARAGGGSSFVLRLPIAASQPLAEAP